eukprot:645193-Ditylum_brightwellii.AAC.1
MGCTVDVANSLWSQASGNSILEEGKRSIQINEIQEEQSRSMLILSMYCVGIADLGIMGQTEAELAAKKEMKKHFECEVLGEMTEYTGCK